VNSANMARTMTPTECRRLLRFALSTIDAACPPEMFPWLARTHPDFLRPLVDRVNLAWARPQFEAVVADFLYAMSAAKAMYELSAHAVSGEAGASL
jgi:hypothetical protein